LYFHPDEKIAILIDGVNLNATHKSLEFDIDYKKLLTFFRSRGRLMKALFYTTVFDHQEYSSVRPLVDWLEYNGFTLVTKLAKEVVDAEGRRRIRGNMHVEMAVDAMRLIGSVDHIVLFASEGGFKSLTEALQQKGVRVSVVSTLHTRPPMVADELRRQADQFIDLADLEPMIGRARAPRPVSVASGSVPSPDDTLADLPEDDGRIGSAESAPKDLAKDAADRPGLVVEKRQRPRTTTKITTS
jgi:uncharacterized LabA/DUF88 family protein